MQPLHCDMPSSNGPPTGYGNGQRKDWWLHAQGPLDRGPSVTPEALDNGGVIRHIEGDLSQFHLGAVILSCATCFYILTVRGDLLHPFAILPVGLAFFHSFQLWVMEVGIATDIYTCLKTAEGRHCLSVYHHGRIHPGILLQRVYDIASVAFRGPLSEFGVFGRTLYYTVMTFRRLCDCLSEREFRCVVGVMMATAMLRITFWSSSFLSTRIGRFTTNGIGILKVVVLVVITVLLCCHPRKATYGHGDKGHTTSTSRTTVTYLSILGHYHCPTYTLRPECPTSSPSVPLRGEDKVTALIWSQIGRWALDTWEPVVLATSGPDLPGNVSLSALTCHITVLDRPTSNVAGWGLAPVDETSMLPNVIESPESAVGDLGAGSRAAATSVIGKRLPKDANSHRVLVSHASAETSIGSSY